MASNMAVRDYINIIYSMYIIKIKMWTKQQTKELQFQPTKAQIITNRNYTKRIYGHPSGQLVSKGWSFSNLDRMETNLYILKVKHHPNRHQKQAIENHNNMQSGRMANSEGLPCSSLTWVCTVCPDLCI